MSDDIEHPSILQAVEERLAYLRELERVVDLLLKETHEDSLATVALLIRARVMLNSMVRGGPGAPSGVRAGDIYDWLRTCDRLLRLK